VGHSNNACHGQRLAIQDYGFPIPTKYNISDYRFNAATTVARITVTNCQEGLSDHFGCQGFLPSNGAHWTLGSVTSASSSPNHLTLRVECICCVHLVPPLLSLHHLLWLLSASLPHLLLQLPYHHCGCPFQQWMSAARAPLLLQHEDASPRLLTHFFFFLADQPPPLLRPQQCHAPSTPFKCHPPLRPIWGPPRSSCWQHKPIYGLTWCVFFTPDPVLPAHALC
jgi:hypothetical protein